MVARENWTAEVPREWVENKDRVLSERGVGAGAGGDEFVVRGEWGNRGKCVRRDMLEHTLADARRHHHPPPFPEPSLPFGEYTFYPTNANADSSANNDLAPRRPSLPNI